MKFEVKAVLIILAFLIILSYLISIIPPLTPEEKEEILPYIMLMG